MTIGFSTLFPRLVAVIDLLENVSTFQATTLKTDSDAVLAAWSPEILDTDSYSVAASFVNAVNGYAATASVASSAKSLVQNEIVRAVLADLPNYTSISVSGALQELSRQMTANAQTIKRSACTVSTSSPAQKSCLAVSSVLANGQATELAFAETFLVQWSGSSLQILGSPSAQSFSGDWPSGSGVNVFLRPALAGGLLQNGALDTVDSLVAGKPASWAVGTGTPGTTISLTDFETQTITIAGTPTAGTYTLTVSDALSNAQTTAALPYNATAAQVQAAIRVLSGFSQVTVTSTGTSPNFVHSIKFNGLPGDIPNIVPASSISPGTITQGNGASVDTGGLANTALIFTGNGSELTRIEQVIFPSAATQYGFHIRMKKQAGATGVIRFRLINGSGAVINDDAGTANSFSVNLTAVSSTDYLPHTAFFRLPTTLPSVVKLEVALTTAINNTFKLYLDEMTLASVTPLASTGLSAVLFSGPQASAVTDAYTLSSTNNFAGRIQKLFQRFFGFQLPSANSPTISDT